MSVIEFTPNGYPRFGGLRRDEPSALSKPGMGTAAWERLEKRSIKG